MYNSCFDLQSEDRLEVRPACGEDSAPWAVRLWKHGWAVDAGLRGLHGVWCLTAACHSGLCSPKCTTLVSVFLDTVLKGNDVLGVFGVLSSDS